MTPLPYQPWSALRLTRSHKSAIVRCKRTAQQSSLAALTTPHNLNGPPYRPRCRLTATRRSPRQSQSLSPLSWRGAASASETLAAAAGSRDDVAGCSRLRERVFSASYEPNPHEIDESNWPSTVAHAFPCTPNQRVCDLFRRPLSWQIAHPALKVESDHRKATHSPPKERR